MISFTIRQLTNIGLIPNRLKQVLVLLGCSTYEDMLELSYDKIKVDYIDRSHHLKDELFKAISDIQELEEIIPEMVESAKQDVHPYKVSEPRKLPRTKFKVGDFTEEILRKSDAPIKQDVLLEKIKSHLPGTYIESIRANLNGDPQNRFVFFLDGYVGLRDKEYDKRYQQWSVEAKKVQYAEQRIMEFLSFIEDKHRSPQPHGLEEEESLYRWYLDFTKSTTKEFAELQLTFKEYLKDYEQWMFTPKEYSYKRNCDQVKWYVEQNMELPTPEDEPELAAWFNSQLGNYLRHKDKRKKMFEELIAFLSDYGIHFYDAKSEEGKAAQKRKTETKEIKREEPALEKYIRLFGIINNRENESYAVHKALLILAIGKLIQEGKIASNEIMLNDDLLTEFADVCIDNVGTASSYNIAIPYYYMGEEPFWNLVPREIFAHEEVVVQENLTFDYIERTFSCSIIDNDLYEVLADAEEFDALRNFLIVNFLNRESDLSDNIQENLDEQEEYEDTDRNGCVDSDTNEDTEDDESEVEEEYDDEYNDEEIDEYDYTESTYEEIGKVAWSVTYRTCGGRQLKIHKKPNDIGTASFLETYLYEIGRAPLFSCDEEIELIQKYKKGDVNAFHKLISANLRYVVSVVKQYRDYGVSMEDLIQEGNIGLIKAIEKYDYRRGHNFFPFATVCIHWHLKTVLAKLQYVVKIPANKASLCREIRKNIERYEQEHQIPPSIYDLGLDETINLSEANSLVMMAMLDKEEMTEPLDENSIPADEIHYSADYKMNLQSINYELHELLHFFTKREQNIILKYYAIDGGKGETLDSIGEQMGMTRERVRQIKEKCLKGLRLLAIKKYHLRILNAKEQEYVDSLLRKRFSENIVDKLKTHTEKREPSSDFSVVIKNVVLQDGRTKEQIYIVNKGQPVETTGVVSDSMSCSNAIEDPIDVVPQKQSGTSFKEITREDNSKESDNVNQTPTINEDNIEHVFLDSKGEIEGTTSLPICSENRSGMPWSSEEEEQIGNYYNQGHSFYAIAKAIGRTEIAVMSRLGMMGLIDYSYGQENKPYENETSHSTDGNEEESEEQEFSGTELAKKYFYPLQDSLFWDEKTKHVYEIYLADNYDLIINHLIFDYNKLKGYEAKSKGLTEGEKEALFLNYWYDNHINVIARIKYDSYGFELLQFDTGININEIVYEPGKYTCIKYTDEDDGEDKFIDYNGAVHNSIESIMAAPNNEVAKHHVFYDCPSHITKEYFRLGVIVIKRIYKETVKNVVIYTDSELGQAIKNDTEEIWMIDQNTIISKSLNEDNGYPLKVYYRNGIIINDGDMEKVREKSLVLQDQLLERIKKLRASLKKKKDIIRYERQLKEIASSLSFFEKESADSKDSGLDNHVN